MSIQTEVESGKIVEGEKRAASPASSSIEREAWQYKTLAYVKSVSNYWAQESTILSYIEVKSK